MENILEIIQSLYSFLGIHQTVDQTDAIGWSLTIILTVLGLIVIQKKRGDQPTHRPKQRQLDEQPEEKLEEKQEVVLPPKATWINRLKKGLARSHQEIWGKLESVMSGENLTPDQIEKMEELLYSSDMGPTLVTELMEELKSKAGKHLTMGDFKSFLFQFLKGKMEGSQAQLDEKLFQFSGYSSEEKRPTVLMIVGINGVGKTTTIGKLATKLTQQGAKVFVGACDTFRAAAVDQLEVWCQRAGAEIVRAKESTDPSGVAFETLQKAIAAKADYCILDTAGRLHTKTNLMEELKKCKRVLTKLDETAPHHTLLVIDAITGQNAIKQAAEFHKTLGLTGLIFTKCDGSSKAGNAVSIVQELKVPVAYIGVGEEVEDLDRFQLDEYLQTLLGIDD